jgi:NTE family protein
VRNPDGSGAHRGRTPLRAVGHPPRTAFVLGGGGNLGAMQVGMLHALFDRGIEPDLVVGCSVGALNGAAIAGDPTPAGVETLAAVWRNLRTDDVFPGGRLNSAWMLLRRALSMTTNEGLRALIDAASTFERFEDAAIPFEVVATSLTTGMPRWFDRGPILDPILASSALPAVFPPVEIDGELYIDGGVIDNVPISRAVALGADRVYVLHVGNLDRPRVRPQRPIDVLMQALSIAHTERFRREVTSAQLLGVDLTVIPAVDPGGISRRDFSRSHELIERARLSTAAFLDRHLEVAAGA